MNSSSKKAAYLMAVLIPYLILIVYSIAVYPDLPKKLESGFPRAMIFLPAFIAIILPVTFAIMVFFYNKYLKKIHYMLIAVFMDIGLLGLLGTVFLIKDAG